MWARAAALGLSAVLVLGVAAPARAGSSVSAQATSGAASIAMDGKGTSTTHIVKVANVTLTSDAVGGCTVNIASGALRKLGDTTSVAIQVVLVGHDVSAPSGDAFTAAAGDAYLYSTGAAGTFVVDLYIKYRPAALQDPGSYVATVALAVVDN